MQWFNAQASIEIWILGCYLVDKLSKKVKRIFNILFIYDVNVDSLHFQHCIYKRMYKWSKIEDMQRQSFEYQTNAKGIRNPIKTVTKNFIFVKVVFLVLTDSPGIPPSAGAHQLFRGFSFVAAPFAGEEKTSSTSPSLSVPKVFFIVMTYCSMTLLLQCSMFPL